MKHIIVEAEPYKKVAIMLHAIEVVAATPSGITEIYTTSWSEPWMIPMPYDSVMELIRKAEEGTSNE